MKSATHFSVEKLMAQLIEWQRFGAKVLATHFADKDYWRDVAKVSLELKREARTLLKSQPDYESAQVLSLLSQIKDKDAPTAHDQRFADCVHDGLIGYLVPGWGFIAIMENYNYLLGFTYHIRHQFDENGNWLT